MRFIYFFILTVFISGCSEKPKTFNGYLDANLIYISSEYSGRLQEFNASKGSFVNKNSYLFSLEQTSEDLNAKISKDGISELMAQKNEIQNKIDYATTNVRRVEKISKDDGVSKDELDNAKLTLANLKQELNAIDFKIKQQQNEKAVKEWKIKQKELFAPDSGVVFDTYYSKGEFVPASMPVLSMVVKNNVKATFYVPEIYLSKLFLGQNIKLVFDGANEKLDAKISYISNVAEYTPPIIFSKEEKQKLVFKIEAKPQDVNLTKLHIGQPVLIEF